MIAWNESYMLNERLTEKYFGVDSGKQLANLNWLLREVNTCLNKIHYRALYDAKDQACIFASIDKRKPGDGTEQDNVRVLNSALGELDKMVADFTMVVSR